MSKKREYDRISDTISIDKFVNSYLGAMEVDCKNLRHIGLKSFNNPYVVGLSNDLARKNPEYIKTGEILLVLDSRGDLGAYINPELLKKVTDRKTRKSVKSKIKHLHVNNLEELGEFFEKINVLLREIKTVEEYEEFLYIVGKENVVENIEKTKKLSLFDDLTK